MLGTLFQDHKTKLLVLVFALCAPIIMSLSMPNLHSLSATFETAWQPVFIFSNTITSYWLYSSNRWKIPASFLMLLTAFSCNDYFYIHYTFAIAFFVSCVFSVAKDKRFNAYLIPYILTIPLFIFDILLGEIAAIAVLVAYHAHLLFLAWTINKKRRNK